MKLISVTEYADVIRENCMKMVDSALLQPAMSTKFTMSVDLKDVLPALLGTAQLLFSAKAYAKLAFLVTHNDKEVAAHGTVFRMEPVEQGSTFLVDDILVYPQEAAAATVESDDEAYGYWLSRQPDDVFNHLRFQAHSHVAMAVSPSGTDLSFYKKLMEQITDFYIFFIINKRMEVWCEIYDLERNIYFENGDVKTIVLFDAGDDSEIFMQTIKDNVKTKAVVYNASTGYGYGYKGNNAVKTYENPDKSGALPPYNEKKRKTPKATNPTPCSKPNNSETTVGIDTGRTRVSDGDGVHGQSSNPTGTRTVYNPNFGAALAQYLGKDAKR